MVFSSIFNSGIYIAVGVKGTYVNMSVKRILNVELSYLTKCAEFFSQILKNKSLFQILG